MNIHEKMKGLREFLCGEFDFREDHQFSAEDASAAIRKARTAIKVLEKEFDRLQGSWPNSPVLIGKLVEKRKNNESYRHSLALLESLIVPAIMEKVCDRGQYDNIFLAVTASAMNIFGLIILENMSLRTDYDSLFPWNNTQQ
jgi:hypothetical protein